MGRDGAGYGFDLGETRRNIFLQMGVDSDLPGAPVGQISWLNAIRRLSIFALFSHCIRAKMHSSL
jgi:hypothetical protein